VFSVLLASLDISPSLVFNWASHSWSPLQSVWPSLDILEVGPNNVEPSPTSHDLVLDYLLVLLEVPDYSPLTLVAFTEKWGHSIPSPSCSPDTFLSLVFDKESTTPSPTCSPDVFWVLFPIQVVLQIFWLFHRTILTCY